MPLPDLLTDGRRRLGFVAVSLSLGAVFAAAGSPVSLYETYRLEDGVNTGQLAVIAASYFVAVAVALLFFGRISDHVGRRPITFAALGLAAAGCLLMLDVHNAVPLIIGRALQGLGGGLASSAVTAYIVDTSPAKPTWLGSVITGTVPMVGLPAGALLSGALVEYEPAPRQLIYLVIVALLAVCAVLVALSPETVRRIPGASRTVRPHIHVPRASRRVLPYAAAVILGTWVMRSFYQAFGPAVSDDQFGTANALVAAAVFASIMLLNPLGGFLTGRLSPARKQRLGMSVFAISIVAVVVSLATGATVPFLVASLFASAGWGVAFSGSVQSLLTGAEPQDRAGVLATIYLISYTSAAIPGLIAGALTHTLTLLQVALAMSTVTVVCSLFVLIATREPGPQASSSAGSTRRD
ncbi:MFS transporter [Polymorphospora rubra]|uniref:MFS transporter n=1 Tax=Polymorphospora rubra TaxID=338584 RepID=A0A810ND50_9ACTN|nr:MFS transporter [Polymorphospora rubra]BCJ69423.1 MFS transporter [Polymorphospora rubra]